MIKDQVIEINFVKSAENGSDIPYMLVYTMQEMYKMKTIEDIEDEKQGGC